MVAEQFYLHVRKTFFTTLFDIVVQITVVIGHRDIQKLHFILESIVAAQNLHYEVSFEHIHYLDFPVLIFGILEYLFDCDDLACSFYDSLVDLSESALADDLQQFDIVGSQQGGSRVHGTFGIETRFHKQFRTAAALHHLLDHDLRLFVLQFFLRLQGHAYFLFLFLQRVLGVVQIQGSLQRRVRLCWQSFVVKWFLDNALYFSRSAIQVKFTVRA